MQMRLRVDITYYTMQKLKIVDGKDKNCNFFQHLLYDSYFTKLRFTILQVKPLIRGGTPSWQYYSITE